MPNLPEWPLGLPTFDVDGFGETEADLLLRTQVDGPIPKQRLTATAGPRPISGQILLTGSQFEIWRRFFEKQIGKGVKRFRFPRTMFPLDENEMMEVRLIAAPAYSKRSSNTVTVALQMEELP